MAVSHRRAIQWTPAAIPFGLVILLLGAWVIAATLVGPYFNFGFFTDDAWVFSDRHWLLLLLPGAAAVVGGLMLTMPAWRLGWLGGLLATVAAAWLLVGPSFWQIWGSDIEPAGGGAVLTALLWVGYFYGVGGLIAYFAGYGQGLLSRRMAVEEVEEERVATEPVGRERVAARE